MNPELLDMDVAQGAPAGVPPMGVQPQGVPPLPPPPIVPQPDPQAQPTMADVAPMPAPGPAPGPSLPAVPSLPVMPQQTKNLTDRESTSTTTRGISSPEERKSFIQGQAANARLGELANEEGGINAEAARRKAAGEEKKAQVLQQYGGKLQEIAQSADKHMAEREQAYQAASDAYKNATPRDIWSYDDAGNKRSDEDKGRRQFWAGIALALGGFTARHNGGHNMGYDMIRSAIERRDQLEQQRIMKLKEVRDEAGRSRDWELNKKHEALADAAAWKQNAYEMAAQQIEARVAQLGPDAAKVKAMQTAEQLRKDGAVTASQYFNDTKTEVRNQVVTKTQQIVGQGLGGAGAGGRAQGKMMEYALMGTSIRDSLKQALAAAPPSAKVLAQLQDNDKTIKSLNESHGTLGALGAAVARKTGAAPRSRFKGIPQEAQEQILGHEIAVDKVAEVLGSDKDSKENIRSILAWAPDDTLETKMKKNEMLKEYAQKAINLSQQYAGVADTGIPGIQAQPSSAPSQQSAPQGPRPFRKADGTTGKLYPDGTFEPDPGQEQPANKKRAIAERLVAARGGR